MKKTFFNSILLVAFICISTISFGQDVSKEQLIRETNELLKLCKQWDYEGIVLDNTGSFKYHICLSPECNPYVSWDFFIKNLKSIELGRFEEYTVINFVCGQKDCIVPTGYEKGGKYEIKNELQFIIKNAKQGKVLVEKMNKLMKLEWSK